MENVEVSDVDECTHPVEALQKDVYTNAMPYPFYKQSVRMTCRQCNKVWPVDIVDI